MKENFEKKNDFEKNAADKRHENYQVGKESTLAQGSVLISLVIAPFKPCTKQTL